jgi:type IV pilus assembly protein PilQ
LVSPSGSSAAVGAVDAAQGAQVPAAAQPAQAAPKPSLDPSKQAPGQITVSNIDFKRGDGGAGRLALRFSGGARCPTCATKARA